MKLSNTILLVLVLITIFILYYFYSNMNENTMEVVGLYNDDGYYYAVYYNGRYSSLLHTDELYENLDDTLKNISYTCLALKDNGYKYMELTDPRISFMSARAKLIPMKLLNSIDTKTKEYIDVVRDLKKHIIFYKKNSSKRKNIK